MSERSAFLQPMEAWPELARFGKNSTIKFNDLNIFYFEAGNPEFQTILMVHGLGDEADTWRHVFFPLAQNYHVIALDLPGFGRSVKPNQKYTPEYLKNAIMGLLDQLEIKKTILMGSSLGGILSHAIALGNPSRIEGLILVGGALLQSGLKGIGLNLMRIPLLGEFIYTSLRKDPDAAYKTLESFYYDLNRLPKADQDFLFLRVNQRVWSDGQRRAYFSTLRNLVPWVRKQQKGLESILANVEIPTFIVRGKYDPLFSPADAQRLLTVQPHTTLIQIDSAGHLPQQEAPGVFLPPIYQWLSKNSN